MIFLIHRRIVAEYEKTIAQMIGEFSVKYKTKALVTGYWTLCLFNTHDFLFQPTSATTFCCTLFICKLSIIYYLRSFYALFHHHCLQRVKYFFYPLTQASLAMCSPLWLIWTESWRHRSSRWATRVQLFGLIKFCCRFTLCISPALTSHPPLDIPENLIFAAVANFISYSH